MIVHVDMDAFFASIEVLDNPDLKGKCVIVGNTSGRGVVCAASYEARKYGAHSAQPVYVAQRKCPQGIFVAPRHDRYHEISIEIMRVFEEITPIVEKVSIDEAYLDATESMALFNNYEELGKHIKERVKTQTGLTCSVGIAPNRFLAKIASEKNKPDGLCVIYPKEVENVVRILTIDQLPGVGKVRQKQFHEVGIQTLGDLQTYSKEQLENWFGAFGEKLYGYARGKDETSIEANSVRKQIGSEVTLLEDTTDKELLLKILLEQTDEVIERLQYKKVRAKTITVKIKYADFKISTHSETISEGILSSREIYPLVKKLFFHIALQKPVRLIGVSAGNFIDREIPKQANLFGEDERPVKWGKMDEAMVEIHQKFGGALLKRGTLTKAPEKPKKK